MEETSLHATQEKNLLSCCVALYNVQGMSEQSEFIPCTVLHLHEPRSTPA